MIDENEQADDFEAGSSDIAIVGMACRFPDADSPSQYWNNLQRGHESITMLTDEELLASGVSKEQIKHPNYVKSGMFLQHMENFDAGFFGFSPMDAKVMDPQHRHFLEVSWEAFEDAGYDPADFSGSVGVFGGSGHNAYMPYNLLTNPDLMDDLGFFLVRHTGNDKDFLTTRVSYCFDLKGPSINVQTACSTSLVAVHSAVQSLLNGECDMALAGGVTIDLPHRRGYQFKDSEILSPDGHCRPFDASSKGTVFGSGAGVLVLRRLDDAIAAKDNIHAVIKASAINNDGAGKVSYLAPSVDGQTAAIHEALEIGEIDPQSVEYVECHGTGTQLGDPIEVAALTQAYGAGHDRKQYCAIGSVKSNIGHLDTAAGVASLIKVVQSLKHKKIPPTLHYRAPNPSIDFSASPFFVNAELRDWQCADSRRAGVSSLGVGGTNAHIIVEEAEILESGSCPRDWQLLMISARSDQALQRATDRLAEFLDPDDAANQDAAPQLADVAYTLAVGRRSFNKRRFAVVQSTADAVTVLDGTERGRIESADTRTLSASSRLCSLAAARSMREWAPVYISTSQSSGQQSMSVCNCWKNLLIMI
ncbi:type I polyketide synthase [Oceanicoccus sp. KOV_DT_Chl]|uniref:type I polyketide synthase n=1 Tax=Oceanicoccus sp. KOV_DT_Chl TaxID=1904639 RepID=UPI000C7A69C7|nr:type I polyketide synthase [Oceanicoccus sp. KOV_DT_Chl]